MEVEVELNGNPKSEPGQQLVSRARSAEDGAPSAHEPQALERVLGAREDPQENSDTRARIEIEQAPELGSDGPAVQQDVREQEGEREDRVLEEQVR